ncbi:MAG: hypothetical protein AB7V16_07365 [Vulcanibacillus sp.]
MLLIKKLTLKNVGIYKGTRELSFDEGLNIIQATNGKGKSTAIQIIEMLIANQYEGSFADYINDDSSEMFASLLFAFNNNEYTIELSCKRGKSGTERILYDSDRNKVASGEEAVSVMATMFDPVLTQYSLVAKQKAIDNIVTCKDSERRELFKKIKEINLEKYIKLHIEPIIENLKIEISNIEKEIYRLENINYDYKDTQEALFAEAEIIEKRKELKALQDKQSLIEKEKTEYEEKKKNLEEAKSLLSYSETSLARKNTLLQACETSIQLFESSAYKENQSKSLKENYDKEFSAIENNIIDLNKKIKEIEDSFVAEKKKLDDLIEDIDKRLSEIKIAKLVKFDDTPLKQLENKIAGKKQDIVYCNKNIKSLEQGICPTCGEKCDHKLQEYVDLKKTYEIELASSEKALLDEQTKKNEYDQLVKDNEELKSKKQTLLSDKELNNTKLESLSDKYKTNLLNCKNQITDKDTQLSKLHIKYNEDLKKIDDNIKQSIEKEKTSLVEYKSDVLALIKEVDNRQTTISTLEKVIQNYSVSDEDYASLMIPLEKDIKEYEATILSNEIVKKNNKELDEKKKQDLIDLNINKEKVIEVKKDLFNQEQARTILLKDFPNYVIDASIQDVEIGMNEFINNIYYKSLNVELRPTKIAIKMEYGLKDQKLPAHRLSGAESKIVSLAFIHYFNTMVGLKCIILDEPDASMNIQIAETLYESLLQMNQIYKQMIIVTHNEKMKNYMIANTQTNVIEL